MTNFNQIVNDKYLELRSGFINFISKRFPNFRMQEIEDIYADTFIAVHDNIIKGRVAADTKWKAYIYQIGLNLSLNKAKDNSRYVHAEEKNSDDDMDSQERFAIGISLASIVNECDNEEEKNEKVAILQREITYLPEPCETILKDFYFGQLSMEEIRKDKSFYRYGNGGVTISGGEPLLQWKFTKELLKACKKEGIHTAIETSLYADQEVIKEILPYLDRIFADFKLATEKDHMHYTGVSNQKIKDNIRYLLETSNRDKVIIRTPMIPGMTATEDNIKGIAKYLNGIYQYVSYEILNYNPLAEAKYHLVDREYCFEENPKLYTKEQMQEFKSWAVEGGLENIIIES